MSKFDQIINKKIFSLSEADAAPAVAGTAPTVAPVPATQQQPHEMIINALKVLASQPNAANAPAIMQQVNAAIQKDPGLATQIGQIWPNVGISNTGEVSYKQQPTSQQPVKAAPQTTASSAPQTAAAASGATSPIGKI